MSRSRFEPEIRSATADESERIVAQARAFIEDWLLRALPQREVPPTRLHGAMHDAVFPGGHRARPILCRLIADLYGGGEDELVGRMAAAVELADGRVASTATSAPTTTATASAATMMARGRRRLGRCSPGIDGAGGDVTGGVTTHRLTGRLLARGRAREPRR